MSRRWSGVDDATVSASESRRSGGVDDEEALIWAAIERLPTFDRLRKAILLPTTSDDEEFSTVNLPNQVDIDCLGLQERKALALRLFRHVEENNSEFLFKLKDRIQRVGIDIPTIEVRFEHLNIEAEAYVGSRASPTLVNFTANLIEGLLNSLHILSSRKKSIKIFHDISGIVRPKRLTLLLGPPGCGKTTFLLALAGKLDKSLKVSGRVTYNGHDMNEFVPQRTAAYISQDDVHIGEMTVRETLSYSARFQGVGYLYDMLSELTRREKAANIKPDPDIDLFMKAAVSKGQRDIVVTDYILKLLGLEICADTVVGNEMTRGISGGQRKRVTTGEMLVGPTNALFMDEISNGLDASTTFQIVKSIRQAIHILNGTAVISLLQPAPETYELFDDVILISDGYIVYQGPKEHILEFFEYMGLRCPKRKGVADFLQEVTSKKDQGQYWVRTDDPHCYITAREFADAFQSFHVGKKLGYELNTPFDKRQCHPAALAKEKYGAARMEILKACISREFLLMKRNSFVFIFKLLQLVIMAIIGVTIFLRTHMDKRTVSPGGSVYVGALFYTVMMIMFNGMSEMSMTLLKLPVFYKHRDLLFFPSWAYAIPSWILQIPITFVEVGAWVFITYYAIGFDPDVGRLFKQYLLLVLLNQMASALFRTIAAVGRTMVVASVIGSSTLLILFALSGFILAHRDMKKWWIWGFWSSPMMYAQNAIAANEFLGKSWSYIPPGSNETIGVQIMKHRSFFPHSYWYWIGVGALLGFVLLFNILYILSLTFLSPFDRTRAVILDGGDTDNRKRVLELTNQGVPLDGESIVAGFAAAPQYRRGMVLPFEPHCITFEDIVYSVDMPQEMKNQGAAEDRLTLLKGISGAFRPGVLTALMGVSGAGKTTMMDVLAGRKTIGYIEGDIRISGYPKKHATFARISGYCEQDDIHSPYVSVYESLIFSAWLRLSPDIDTKTRQMFVEEVMELVELTSLREALVGLPGVSGLSTEQRKRLTIAVELVANPSIIFMDEPTSGLDARAAAIVMRTVRNTVDTGRTVVCTIHQPSIDIFEAFDELLLLKRGGEEIYVGPLGQFSCHLIQYFEAIPGVKKIKDGCNPATWMLDISTNAQEMALGVDFTEIYKNSTLFESNKRLIRELATPRAGSQELSFATKYAKPFKTQVMACLWKQHCSYWRNPHYNAVRLLFTTGIAVMFGSMFWDLGKNTSDSQDLFNAMGSMYAACLFLGVENASSIRPVVGVERTVFYREKAAGLYSALPYALAQAFIEIPYVLIQAIVYGVIVYAMIGFEWSIVKFLWYIYFMFFTFLYFTYYGMMTVAVTPNHHIANIVASAFYALWNIFSGFIIPITRIPIWWRWYYWTSPLAWTLYGLVTSQFGDLTSKLSDQNGQTVEEYLEDYFGFKHDLLGVVAVVIAGFAVLFVLTFALSIKVFNYQKR
ncbi:pleiotropic drug resistance protein 1-like isoform X2 [Silene latifolia]|uniref:pleiotropic drug resistance protein 1-like isoform X2 n=1 Tax=Silene latifolia TaxID=37657 RepID=UPI003D7721AE